MKVKFKEAVDIYPDGVTMQSVQAGEECELADDYAQLMIAKGHADAVAASANNETRGRK